MAALRIKQTRAAAPLPGTSQKKTAKPRPNIAHKFEAQVSQETFLEAEAVDLPTEKDEYLEEENSTEQDDMDHLIEYDADEIDTDDDSDLDSESKESIFDSSNEVSYHIRPDIVLEEIVLCSGKEQATLSVFIPSKIRSLGRNVSQEHEIRTEALERIGKLLAARDEEFLLSDVFDASLISTKKQKEIARLIGKDETWITRLKQSCIVETPRWGLQPLSLFFPGEVPLSVKDYSEAVIYHISNETSLKPLTVEELASLISQGDPEYKALTANAGSKLRRILEKLLIPPPKDRLILAKAFADQLAADRNASSSDLIDRAKNSGKKSLSKLLIKYRTFSDKLIQKLKNKELIK